MNTLADVVIAAISYISTPQSGEDREDNDALTLEILTAMLRQGSAPERDALRAALERARQEADPELLETFQALETQLLD